MPKRPRVPTVMPPLPPHTGQAASSVASGMSMRSTKLFRSRAATPPSSYRTAARGTAFEESTCGCRSADRPRSADGFELGAHGAPKLGVLEHVGGGARHGLGGDEQWRSRARSRRRRRRRAGGRALRLVADREVRVDGGHGVADVAHVGGAGTRARVGLARQGGRALRGLRRSGARAPGCSSCRGSPGCSSTSTRRRTPGPRRARSARRSRARARAPRRWRAHRNIRRRVLGDDVHGLAAVGDEAVHAHAVAEVDALRVDQAERLEARRERALAVPGRGGGVRRRAVEREREPAVASAGCARRSRS